MIEIKFGSGLVVKLAIFLTFVAPPSFSVPAQVIYEGEPNTAVRVTSNKLTYHRGEPIVVTIYNDLSFFIYAPPRHRYCSVVRVQRSLAGMWIAKESCPPREPPPELPSVIAIAPKSRTWGNLGPAQGREADGSIISAPVSPFESRQNFGALLPGEPRMPGDPIPEIPEGVKRPLFSALDSVLEPGRYRMEFSFTVGTISGPIRTVHSKEFTVTD